MLILDLVKHREKMMQDTFSWRIATLSREFMHFAGSKVKEETGLGWGSVPFILFAGKHPGCTQAEMTKALHLDWGHSQRMTKKLEEAGFFEITAENAKKHSIRLTESGEKAFRTCHSVFPDFDLEVLSPLTEEERATLFSLLAKLGDKDRRNEKLRYSD